MNDHEEGTGVSKSDLLIQFWAYRRFFAARIRRSIFCEGNIEDIFQEACLRLLASSAVFPHPQAGTRYFCKILDSLIAEYRKRGARLKYLHRVPDTSVDFWQKQAEGQLEERVCEAVNQLPTEERKLLTAHLNHTTAGVEMPRSTRHYRLGKIILKLRSITDE